MLGRTILMVAQLLLAVICSAQGFFTTLSVNDGLPTNVIAAVAQDEHQFIWVGTGNGLSRYDGYHFRVFRKGDKANTIPSNQISCLVSDDGFIWVGTWNGLCKINTTTLAVTRVDLGAHRIVRALFKDKDDILWIGTATALLRYDKKDNNFTAFTSQNSKLSHNTIRSIYRDTRGNLWVGTYDKLNQLKAGASVFSTFDLKGNYKPNLKNNLICDIKPYAPENDSLLWVGTETGLCLLNTVSGQFRNYNESNTSFSNEVVKTIYTDDDHRLWLGTDFGLQVFDPVKATAKTYFHNPRISYSIANNVIWQIFEDAGGVIWFVTSNGISKLNKHQNVYDYHEISYRADNQIIGNQVKAALMTKTGVLWLATLHGAIRIDPLTGKAKIFDTNGNKSTKILLNNVFALEEDDRGRIWIGTAGGINIWDEKMQRMHALTSDQRNGLTSNYIARFTKASDGSFWVSAWEGGLFRIDGNFDDISSLHFQLMGDFGSEKNTAGDNAIWIVKDNELYKIDLVLAKSDPIESFHEAAKRRDINSVYFSLRGKLWASTLGGLIEYDPQLGHAEFRALTGSSLNLGSFLEDAQGNIWATGTNSVVKYMPEENRYELFPLDRDLPMKSFFNGCATKGLHNEIIFGGDNGYITVFPERVRQDRYKPPVYITSIRVNNSDMSLDEDRTSPGPSISFIHDLTLKYSERSVTFEFASLHYWQPAMNSYAYRLDGFDQEWHYTSGNMNFAIYSNLPSGSYTFRVRGSNNHAVWSDQEASLPLTIKPPLFLSGWFIAFYVLIAIGATWLSLRTYSARLRLKNELQITRLEKAHAEEIAQTKQQFFTNISHELRTPVSLILPPIHQVVRKGILDPESRQLMTLAEKNSVRLIRLVDQILDFRKIENGSLHLKITSFDFVKFCHDVHDLFVDNAKRKDIDFTFLAGENQFKIWGDAEKLETILFNLLSNAFKFTPKGGTIGVWVETQTPSYSYPSGSINVHVRDSGVGIPLDEQPKIFERYFQSSSTQQISGGYGIGLNLAYEYARLHHGEIKFTSEPGKGTAFTLILPISANHFPLDTIHREEELNLLASKAPTAAEEYRFDIQSEKPLLLLVENNPDVISFIKIALKEKYNFITAEHGEEGLAKAVSFQPEVIVSDIMMPVMDGLTFCKKIKENPRTSHISIILLTAKQLDEQKVEGIRLGADSYLTKPFEIELLEAHIDQLIRRNQELQSYFRSELTQASPDKPKTNGDEKFIERVMSIIQANISNPEFGVELLCRDIGMSSTQLYRRLMSITHLSAGDVIKKYRIKKASLLLRNKEGNISEIMYSVGFSNLSYFSKCFKKEYGLTPKDYQQQVGVNSIEIDRKLDLEFGRG